MKRITIIEDNNAVLVLWVSTTRTIFPPVLTAFGLAPDRVIFIDLTKDKELSAFEYYR